MRRQNNVVRQRYQQTALHAAAYATDPPPPPIPIPRPMPPIPMPPLPTPTPPIPLELNETAPAPRPPRHRAPKEHTHITLTTYNVVSAHQTKLLEALRAMADLNTDITILTETKLCHGRHMRHGHGYTVFTTSATSTQQGGIALIWKTAPAHWTLEGMRVVSPNTISATLVLGTQWWLILGTYLTPNASPDKELMTLENEYQCHPKIPVILLGDLNADLDDTENARSIAIATTMQHLGVMDSIHKFPQKNRCRHT